MSISKFTVSRDDAIYEAWPDVALTESGRLVCVFAECDHHGDRMNARIMITESGDRGRTWSPKRPLTEKGTRERFYNCPRLSLLPDGRLCLVCDLLFGPEKPETKTEIHLWTSPDEGKTWQGPVVTPATGIVPDRYRVLSSGRHVLSSHWMSEKTGKLAQHLWYSDDAGKSWQGPVTVADDERYALCEGSILETPTGELVCFLRENSGRGLDCMKTISRDGGKTWSDVTPVPIPGCHRPVAGYLQSGEILVTHRFMQGGKGWLGAWTQNVFAALLRPDQILETERKAQSARILPLDYDRSPVSDLGYTGWVQFPDGEIYVVNYIVDDAPKAQIRGYSLRREDFILD